MATETSYAGADSISEEFGMTKEALVSADSHVTEPFELWNGILEREFWGNRPDPGSRGTNPMARGLEMQEDGVIAEVLYPTLGLKVFSIEEPEVQEAACHAYNEWLVQYCQADPSRLVGIAMIACYDPDKAVAELRAASAAGLRGALVWQSPHPDLPFTSFHYDPIWQAAEELGMPINLHILTGFNYSRVMHDVDASREIRLRRIDHYRGSVNQKIAASADTLLAFIFGGVLERFPRLKLVVVENEVAWLPFYLDQWDYYYHRFLKVDPTEITKPPSEYFDEQIYLTFFRDPWVGRLLPTWGQRNIMWSNDYPHANSTWPKSRQYVASQLTGLDPRIVQRVIRDNCVELYDLKLGNL